MNQQSFLARRSLGYPNYLLIALAGAFLIALAPVGAYKAVRSNSNNIDSWLPASREAIANLAWFREQFDGDQFVLVSWDGCTLGENAKLQRVARSLASDATGAGSPEQRIGAAASGQGAMFARVTTGAEAIEQLMAAPYNLPREAAIDRLEGTLIGPTLDGAHGGGVQSSRTTCLAVDLTPQASGDEGLRREAIERIREVVATEAHVAPAMIHLAGPAVDAVGIGDECRRTLALWGSLVGVAGFGLCCWRLKNIGLAAAVVTAAMVSAAMSLALVYYVGVIEVVGFEQLTPQLGVADAVVTGIPALVYVLALSAALRLVYYYRDARLEGETNAATEIAISAGRPWWTMTALLVAAVLGSWCLCEIVPIRRFVAFAGIGLIASVAIVLSIMSVYLHRFPLSREAIGALSGRRSEGAAPRWTDGLFEFGAMSWFAVMVFCVATLGLAGWGLTALDASPRLPAMANGRSRLARDYAWMSEHVGHAAPMEVVLTVPVERCREPQEPAEEDGQQYRLTLAERMELMQTIEERLEVLPHVSGVMSPATATPLGVTADEAGDAVRQALEKHGYLRAERHRGSQESTGRELWRLSARVASGAAAGASVNYAELLGQVRLAVDPVLVAYEQRDLLVKNLHERGQQLAGAKVCILFRAANNEPAPAQNSIEQILADLLRRSGVSAEGVTFVNLASLSETGRAAEALRERTLETLKKQNAAVLASAAGDPAADQLLAGGINVVNAAVTPGVEESESGPLVDAGGPRPIRAVYTGMPPVAIGGELMASLSDAAVIAVPLLALAMMALVANPVGGILVMLPVLFPVCVVVGLMGWAGLRIDLGIMLIAGLAIGVTIDGAMNFLAWFRRGTAAGLFQQEAARMAYARVAPGMFDALIIAGFGMLPLAMSGIASMQLIGLLTAGIMLAAMMANISLLPALVCSPLGRFFGAVAAPSVTGPELAPVTIEGYREDVAATLPGRPHVGAGAARSRPATEDRREMADGPHSALHAKLQRLRHSSGDSAAS